MSDEVSTGELSRAIAELKGIVQALVSQREYAEFQRHVTHRLGEHDRDIEGERHARETAIEGEQKAREAALEKLHNERAATQQTNRAAFLACVGGILGALVVAAVVAWVSGKGGH